MKPSPDSRSQYYWFTQMTTKFQDNDIYGHLNNNIHSQFIDNAVNLYLSQEGGLDMAKGSVIGLIVNSGCDYFAELGWPEHTQIDVGVRVNKIGRSSVQYGAALFVPGGDKAAAQGHFTHVWIDRDSRASVEIPAQLRAAMEKAKYGG
ncbi:MAG: acyl-CoA thioesterase [Cellvibrionaceae bacterium]|nr:acyl-CoA thioesterase [Cellvibrionaceae bacterium]